MQDKPLRIAAFTMCYAENQMLPLWVKHYGKLVGYENLYILDHGRNPPAYIDLVQTIPVERQN